MNYGSRAFCKGKEGIIFLDVGTNFRAFERQVGVRLPQKCEDIFDVRGPFIIQRHQQNDMVFLFNNNNPVDMIILTQWIDTTTDVVWVSDYLEDVGESEDSATPPTVEL